MFSSFAAQVHRTLVICWLVVMVFTSLLANSSLLFRRRDKPRLLPDKMMRSWNRPPALRRICNIPIPGDDRTCSNRGEQHENFLLSRRIRGDEARLLGSRDLHDNPYAREMRPVSVRSGPDVPNVCSRRNPHLVKLLRNDPRLIRFVAHYVKQVMRRSPPRGERWSQNDHEMKALHQLRLRSNDNTYSRQRPKQQHQGERSDVPKLDKNQRVHAYSRSRRQKHQPRSRTRTSPP